MTIISDLTILGFYTLGAISAPTAIGLYIAARMIL